MHSRSSSMYRASKGAASNDALKEGIQQRIAQKQQEHDSLLQLKHQSDTLLQSMHDLEAKLDTLNGGTEAVASVLANWASVFKAINIATVKLQGSRDDDNNKEAEGNAEETEMPETLVRIATEKGLGET